MFERDWFNVRKVEPIDSEPRDADQRWYRVAVDDGTIPASLKVWIGGSDSVRVDDVEALIRDELRRQVKDVPGGPANQVAALRAKSPVQLHPPPV
jgi:hypothetical protein